MAGKSVTQRATNKERLISLMGNHELITSIMNNKWFTINRNIASNKCGKGMSDHQATNELLLRIINRIKSKPATDEQLIKGFSDVDSDEWVMFDLNWAISRARNDVSYYFWKSVKDQEREITEYTDLIDMFRLEHETEDSKHSDENLIDEAVEIVKTISDKRAIKRIEFVSTILESGKDEFVSNNNIDKYRSHLFAFKEFTEKHKDEIHNYFTQQKIKQVEDELAVVNEFVAIIENRSRNLNEINKLMRANPELFDEYIFQSKATWVVRLANDFREADQRDAYLLINYMYSHQELLIEHKQRLVNQLIEIKPKTRKPSSYKPTPPNPAGKGRVQVWLKNMSDEQFEELINDTKLLRGKLFTDKWHEEKKLVNRTLKKLDRSSD